LGGCQLRVPAMSCAEVTSAGECGVVKRLRNRFVLTLTAAVVRLRRTGIRSHMLIVGVRLSGSLFGISAVFAAFVAAPAAAQTGGADQDRLQHGADGRARTQRQVSLARPEDLGGGYQCQRRAARPSREAHPL